MPVIKLRKSIGTSILLFLYFLCSVTAFADTTICEYRIKVPKDSTGAKNSGFTEQRFDGEYYISKYIERKYQKYNEEIEVTGHSGNSARRKKKKEVFRQILTQISTTGKKFRTASNGELPKNLKTAEAHYCIKMAEALLGVVVNYVDRDVIQKIKKSAQERLRAQ